MVPPPYRSQLSAAAGAVVMLTLAAVTTALATTPASQRPSPTVLAAESAVTLTYATVAALDARRDADLAALATVGGLTLASSDVARIAPEILVLRYGAP